MQPLTNDKGVIHGRRNNDDVAGIAQHRDDYLKKRPTAVGNGNLLGLVVVVVVVVVASQGLSKLACCKVFGGTMSAQALKFTAARFEI